MVSSVTLHLPMPLTLAVNPFARRDSHSAGAVITYKVLTVLSWLLSLVTTVYYSGHWNSHVHDHLHPTIWAINYTHYSGFTQNSIITSLYW